jgi:hypothetical protein
MNMSKAALKPCQTTSLGAVSRTDRSLKQKVRAAPWGISIPFNHHIRIQDSETQVRAQKLRSEAIRKYAISKRLLGSAGALISPKQDFGMKLSLPLEYQYCLRCRSCMPCGVHAVLEALLLLHEPLSLVPGGRALRMSRAGIQQHSRLL